MLSVRTKVLRNFSLALVPSLSKAALIRTKSCFGIRGEFSSCKVDGRGTKQGKTPLLFFTMQFTWLRALGLHLSFEYLRNSFKVSLFQNSKFLSISRLKGGWSTLTFSPFFDTFIVSFVFSCSFVMNLNHSSSSRLVKDVSLRDELLSKLSMCLLSILGQMLLLSKIPNL